jgi:AcrR family transcriptional regulator
MGITERKERERQEMKSRIVEAATRMFLEEGFEKFSIRSIAEKIEYSPATIYLYFKDKNQLFYEVHEQGFAKLFERFEPLNRIENPMDRLYRMGEAYLRFAFENPEYYELMFIMKAPLNYLKEQQEVWEGGMKNFDFLQNTVRECQEQGLMKPVGVDIATMSIFSFVHGLVALALRDRFEIKFAKEDLPRMFSESIHMMLHLMKSPRGGVNPFR